MDKQLFFKYENKFFIVLAVFTSALFIGAVCFDIDIPYFNIILCGVFWMCVAFFFAKIDLPFRQKIFTFVIPFFVGIAAWYLLSYKSYYDGASRQYLTSARIYYKITKSVIESDISDQSKFDILEIIKSGSYKEHLILKKNDKILIEKPFAQNASEGYIVESYEDYDKNFNRIFYGNDEYQFIYEFANKPTFFSGIFKAVTMSAFDKNSDSNFITWKNYNRSYNFALFFVVFVCATYLYFLKENTNKVLELKKDELANSNKMLNLRNTELNNQKIKLELTNHKLNDTLNDLKIFRLTYEQIQNDFKRQGISSKNFLQPMLSTWEQRQTAAAKLARHDAINEIIALKTNFDELNKDNNLAVTNFSDYRKYVQAYKNLLQSLEPENFDLIKCTHDFLIMPWIGSIKKSLSGFDTVLDISITVESVSTVIESITSPNAIPKMYLEGKAPADFYLKVSKDIDTSAKCKVIKSKLDSIIFNIISNSAQAIQRLAMKDDDFEGNIFMNVFETEKDLKQSLCIEIKDNGGGFSEDKVNKVYREPVKSSKGDRYGEATAYIGWFIKNMEATIEPENYVTDDGKSGAITRIYIHYLTSEEVN